MIIQVQCLRQITFRICSVKFTDCPSSVLGGLVSNVGDTFRAASSIINKRELPNRTDAVEEILESVSAVVLGRLDSSVLHPSHPLSDRNGDFRRVVLGSRNRYISR